VRSPRVTLSVPMPKFAKVRGWNRERTSAS
jgi:hypothetical protein